MKNKSRSIPVPVGGIVTSEPRHAELPSELLTRIDSIARVFDEVDGRPVEHWVRDFRRDLHPEREIAIWEAMAAAFKLFNQRRSLGAAAKKESFQLLLLRAMHSEHWQLDGVKLVELSRQDALALLQLYDTTVKPMARSQ